MATLWERRYSEATARLRARSIVACSKMAESVLVEASATPGHAERMRYASSVLNLQSQARACAAVLSALLATWADPRDLEDVRNGGTAPNEAAADTNLQTAVAAVWNPVSGFDPN